MPIGLEYRRLIEARMLEKLDTQFLPLRVVYSNNARFTIYTADSALAFALGI